MRCPECGLLNSDGLLLCAGCGAALVRGSSAAAVTATADGQSELALAEETMRRLRRLRRYVPPVVVEGILHDREWLRGERREVAVLFADAVGFTSLAASLDAESVFELINDLLGRLVECVHRYDGMVDKFTGDGLMAVFGAPIAHENDAELALRAALDMQKAAAEFEPIARARLGAPLQIRIGIHSGLVVAGIIGAEEQAAYTVIGETVNVAARLQALARPGYILVGPPIYEQTRTLFEFQAMGAIQVKGIDESLSVYEVVGERPRPLPARGIAGVSSVFLGRDAELQQLRGFLEAFLEDRRGRLVVIQGDAGVGKSRLVSEWLSTVPPDQLTICYGHASPYARGGGYDVFRSLLQEARRTWPPGLEWDNQVSPSLRIFLWQVLGLLPPEEMTTLRHLEPERVKQLTILALREWVLSAARLRPVVFVLEDFQWADDLSRDAVQALVPIIQEAPVLLCIVARPRPEMPLNLALPSQEPSPAMPAHLQLELKPLSPEDSRALLAHLVGLDSVPDMFVNVVQTYAEGNPFYIEEFVRMLIEKEALVLQNGQWRLTSSLALQTLEIPTTLRGLVMARVDRLPEDLQALLRSAAVIGTQFSARLLEKVERRLHGHTAVVPALERLCHLGLLVECPQAGEQVFAFRHIVTQEAIYRSLLRSQRPELHRVVAECIESLYADLTEHVEALALHYDRAHVRDRALYYTLWAGNRARDRFANREAIEYYSRALQISQHLSGYAAERWQAAVGLGQVEQRIGEYHEAVACYQAALEEWEEAPREARVQAMLGLAQVWSRQGALPMAEDWLERALEQLGNAADAFPLLRAQIYSELGWVSLCRGDLDAAQEQLAQGLVLVKDTEQYDVLSTVLNRLGAVHYSRGEWEQAARYVEEALALCRQLGDLVGYGRSLNSLGSLKQSAGDWSGALADYEQAVELHERVGEVEGLALACANLGVLYTVRGEWGKAEETLLRSLTTAQRLGRPHELAQAHVNLGRLYLLQGRRDDCACHLDAAIPLCREAGSQANPTLSEVYRLQSILRLEQGQTDLALEWAGRCRELLRRVTGGEDGESPCWGRYEQLMGRIAWATGNLAAARRHLERSAAIFDVNGAQYETGQTTYWSALLWLEQQQPEKAREELLAARGIFERLGAAADLRLVEEQLARLT